MDGNAENGQISEEIGESERGQARLTDLELIGVDVMFREERFSTLKQIEQLRSLKVRKAGLPPLFGEFPHYSTRLLGQARSLSSD